MLLSNRLIKGVFLGIGFLFLSSGVSWGEKAKEIQVSLGANPLGAMYGVGVEFETGKKSTLLVRGGGFSYYYEEDGYTEEGGGSVVGAYGKFYSENLMEGMYFGFGIDRISVAVDWWEYVYMGDLYGHLEAEGFAPGIMIGNKMNMGEVMVEPNLFVSMLPGDLKNNTIFAIGVTIGFPMK